MPPDQTPLDEVATSDARQQDAAEQLVRENAGWMLVLAERMLNDAALAEDVVQEALINALRGLHRFEKQSTLKTWRIELP